MNQVDPALECSSIFTAYIVGLNPYTPAAHEVADDVIYRRFQGEGVEFFFEIGPH